MFFANLSFGSTGLDLQSKSLGVVVKVSGVQEKSCPSPSLPMKTIFVLEDEKLIVRLTPMEVTFNDFSQIAVPQLSNACGDELKKLSDTIGRRCLSYGVDEGEVFVNLTGYEVGSKIKKLEVLVSDDLKVVSATQVVAVATEAK